MRSAIISSVGPRALSHEKGPSASGLTGLAGATRSQDDAGASGPFGHARRGTRPPVARGATIPAGSCSAACPDPDRRYEMSGRRNRVGSSQASSLKTDARSGAEARRLDPFHPRLQEASRRTSFGPHPRRPTGPSPPRGGHPMRRSHGDASRVRRRSGGSIVPALVMTHGVPSPLRRAVAASSRATTRLATSRGSTALASMLCGQTVSVAGPSSSSRLTSRRLRRFLPTREPRSQETLSRGSLPRENRDVPGLLSTGCASPASYSHRRGARVGSRLRSATGRT